MVSGLFGGAATLALHSGNLPGTVVISATAIRADNNVDNGIQMAITNYAMVSIGTGEITSPSFTCLLLEPSLQERIISSQ